MFAQILVTTFAISIIGILIGFFLLSLLNRNATSQIEIRREKLPMLIRIAGEESISLNQETEEALLKLAKTLYDRRQAETRHSETSEESELL